MAYFFFRFTALEGLYFSIIFTDTDIYTDRQVVHVDLGLAGTRTCSSVDMGIVLVLYCKGEGIGRDRDSER